MTTNSRRLRRLASLSGAALAALACSLGALSQPPPTAPPLLPPTEAPAVEAPSVEAPPAATQPPAAAPAGPGPSLANCPLFPGDNVWNVPVDRLPLDPNSQTFVETIGPDVGMHPDFGSGLYEGEPIGIPYVEVPADQAGVTVAFEYDDESDPGPYPIPADPPIEGGPNSDNDRHILIVQRDACLLFELYYAWPENDGTWRADSGAIFDLNSNQLRPETWTSADAAGLPILPGLVRYEEVSAGEIRHALRFTAPETQHAYVWPARHFASELTGQAYPPLGQRFRLRGDFDLSSFSPDVQIILRALQRYGMFLADNGSAWFLSGAPDERWDNDVLSELGQVQGSDFEAVDASSLMVDPDSAQAAGPTFEAGPLPPTSAPGAAGQGGHISYTLENNRVYLIAAEAGAQPEDVSQALDGLAEGADDGWLNLSPDGSWLALDTDRFDSECVGWTCLAILPADLSSGEAIRAGDELVHPEGKSAVASGGNLLVKPAGGGPHDRDLFVSTRSGGEWSATAALTEASPYAYLADCVRMRPTAVRRGGHGYLRGRHRRQRLPGGACARAGAGRLGWERAAPSRLRSRRQPRI